MTPHTTEARLLRILAWVSGHFGKIQYSEVNGIEFCNF